MSRMLIPAPKTRTLAPAHFEEALPMNLTRKRWIVTGLLSALSAAALAGQAPGPASAPDVAISHADRFYTSDQFANTVSVVDPADNKLLGVINLGDQTPTNL